MKHFQPIAEDEPGPDPSPHSSSGEPIILGDNSNFNDDDDDDDDDDHNYDDDDDLHSRAAWRGSGSSLDWPSLLHGSLQVCCAQSSCFFHWYPLKS